MIPFLASDEKRRRIRERSSMPDGRAAGRRGMQEATERDGERERETPADGARWNERDRERERRQARHRDDEARWKARLARSAVGSHGCAAYLHLLSPLFSLLLLRRHWALSAARSSFLLGPACSSFDFSVSLVLAAAISRLRSRADRPPLYPAIRLLLLLLLLSFFLSFSADARFFTYNRT